ncbi:hypothetical protein JCM16303_004710 [Sporobolomyces ruberrimus]
MTPTSPTNSSSTTGSTSSSARPPARNKSSSSLSTHTLRSLSSTTSGKPRRNKSAVSLHHGHGHHGAGHHNVQFTAHRKMSHGASGSASQAMKRRNSSQSASTAGSTSSGGGGGGGAGNPFGLGMTSMTKSDSQDGSRNERDGAHDDEEGQERREERPDLGPRRTSSSSSTATIVGGSRSRSRGARRQNSGDVRGRDSSTAAGGGGGSRSRANSRNRRESPARKENKVTPSGSVTSTTSDWASETDSPLHIGRKLPDVEVQKDFKPEGTSGLSMALEGENQTQQNKTRQQSRNATPSRLRKSKFQFAEDDDDDEEDDEEEGQKAPAPEIPAAAMPPAETPALPVLPAMLEAITPARSPDPDEVRAPEQPTPEQTAETAALQAPSAPSAPQGISPPDHGEFGQPPPVAGPEISRSPSPMPGISSSGERIGRPGVDEPSLAQAANVDEPNMAIMQDKEHQQKHQGLKSVPRPTIQGNDSPSHSNKVTPEEGRSPAGPTPTTLQKEEQEQVKRNPSSPQPNSSSSSSQLPRPSRTHPTRKSSNASIMSLASTRSAAPSLISRMAPPPHFRRSASGIAPTVSREAIVRGEMATPSPEPISEDGQPTKDSSKSRRNGTRSATFSTHERTSSQTSNRSLRAPPVTESPSRRSNTYAGAELQRSRTSDSSGGGGGALAALGQIHQAATARTPSITSPGGVSEGSRTPGALTHAKRSASGYFSSALRGLTSLPSALTPPLSPSAGSSSYTGVGSSSGGKHPIPGSSGISQQGGGAGTSGSYGRSGGRLRSSPSPQQPPLIVKFVEQPSLPPPPPSNAPNQDPSTTSTSPRQSRPTSLSQAHRNASSASLAMSRTQQKALLARDAPYSSNSTAPSSSSQGLPPSNGGGGLAPPPSPIPTSQSHPYLPSHPPSSSSSPSPAPSSSSGAGAGVNGQGNGMQRWAFGLIKEAERIERQWRCIEKWRDPVGESLERVLHKTASTSSTSRAMERTGSASGSASGRDSGNESTSVGGNLTTMTGSGKLVRLQKGRSMTAY